MTTKIKATKPIALTVRTLDGLMTEACFYGRPNLWLEQDGTWYAQIKVSTLPGVSVGMHDTSPASAIDAMGKVIAKAVAFKAEFLK